MAWLGSKTIVDGANPIKPVTNTIRNDAPTLFGVSDRIEDEPKTLVDTMNRIVFTQDTIV